MQATKKNDTHNQIPAALVAFEKAAQALRAAAVNLQKVTLQSEQSAALAVLCEPRNAERIGLVTAILGAEDHRQQLFAAGIASAEAATRRIVLAGGAHSPFELAIARGTAKAIASCPCTECQRCEETARARAAGRDPVEEMTAQIVALADEHDRGDVAGATLTGALTETGLLS